MKAGPRILFLDIELKPLKAYAWGPWEQNLSHSQLLEDYSIISYAARWAGSRTMLQEDLRKARDYNKDKVLLKSLHRLLNEADVIITQNGIKFDARKINTRLIKHGFSEPSPYQHIDTLRLAKKKFGFTFNSLEYLAKFLGCPEKKKSRVFIGQELWNECMLGNPKAWLEMAKYNKNDIIALEGVYDRLKIWGVNVDFAVYSDTKDFRCNCGSTNLIKQGFRFTSTGKYQAYQCKDCRSWKQGRVNLLSKAKKASLRGSS